MSKTNLKPTRTFMNWCVDLCVSWWADVEPPGWLRAAVRRNAAFRRSCDKLDALTDKLKRDAGAWSDLEDAGFPGAYRRLSDSLEPAGVPRNESALPNSGRRLLFANRRLITCIAATSAATAILVAWRLHSPSERSITPTNPTIVAEEKSETLLKDEMRAIAQVVGDSWDTSEAYVASISPAIADPFPLDGPSIGNAVSQRVRSFSRSYGQAVDFVAQRVERLKP